jgi:hypothetical protein
MCGVSGLSVVGLGLKGGSRITILFGVSMLCT